MAAINTISVMNNDIKSQLQQREFQRLKDEHRVILKWATGCGKSKMTIDLINYYINPLVSGKIIHKVLFVVAERAHINNWEEEFNKWHLNRSNICTDVCCYNSLHKYKDFHYDIVVLDEAHHAFTEKRMTALEELKNNMTPYGRVYLLSATLSVSKQIEAEAIFGKFTTSTITLKDAIKSDILSNPRVYIVGLELDDTHVTEEVATGKGTYLPKVSWEDRNKYIFGRTHAIIKCTPRQKYIYYTSTMEYWKQRYTNSRNEIHHNKWVNYGSQRKRFLGESKINAVRDLLRILPSPKRFVCFCASIAQAERLCSGYTISSRRPTKHNQAIIDDFNAKKSNRIFAVGMITEGMNLTDINMGIIVQLDGKERLFIQKFGRSMRANDPVSVIFYYKNTQDETYLKHALENIEDKYIRYITPEQLNTIKL